MMGLTRGLQGLQRQVDVQTNIEIPSAALTLTRSATLAITAAGTTITWQSEVRNSGFTWSGANITIPTAGYYSIAVIYAASGAHTGIMRLFVNTINVLSMPGDGLGSVRHAYNMTRYFQTGDAIQVSVISSVITTMQVTAEGVTNESPFFHIVQLTGAV
jgi:hypothetical protein